MPAALPSSRLDQVATALRAEYDVIRLLGQGGMAAVYLARERSLKRLVAIKVLDPELAASAVFRARFQREAEMAAQLHHANIVPIYRVGEAGGISFFTMGFVDGESLADRMRRERKLPLADALRIGREIAAALGSAHRRGIVHRDVKPQNVLIERESGRVLVTDFGIARAAMTEPAPTADGDVLTGVGMVMGTPRYMSPEQAAGTRDLTPASDLYALGLILYECIAGSYPYRVATPPNFLVAHLTLAPVPLGTVADDVPYEVGAAIDRLLAKDPSDRFGSADEVVAALTVGHVSRARIPPPPRVRAHRRRGILIAVAALLIVAAIAATGAMRGTWPFPRSRMPDGADPRQSILIGFFTNTREQPALDWLRVGGVELLAQSLARWEDLQVVDAERLLDLARRAGIATGAQLSQDDATRLARSAGVWTTALGSVVPRGDSLTFTVRVYDVASGRQLTTATASAPAAGDLTPAFNSLAAQILEIGGGHGQPLAVEPPTRSIEAYRAYIEGIEARSRWDNTRAQAAFTRAIQSDSTFALAYYELSQLYSDQEMLSGTTRFVDLADRAVRSAVDRPPREQLLLQAYAAYAHARFSEAKAAYRQLLAQDSTIADAWAGLGSAEQLDLTLRRDSRGREYLPASYTTALHAFERALALGGGDHRYYANLTALLGAAALDRQNVVYGFADEPRGALNTVYFRRPKRTYTPLLIRDSIALVPSESLSMRYAPHVVDSLRAVARSRALDVARRWLAIAPDEGVAHLFLADLLRAERQWDQALTELRTAARLRVSSPVPLVVYRVAMLLEAQRLDDATALADSVLGVPTLRDSLLGPASLASAPLANALLVGGRMTEADALARRVMDAVGVRDLPPATRRIQSLALSTAPLAFRAAAGRATRDQLTAAAAEVGRQVAAAPDSERKTLTEYGSRAVLFAAASLGDTAAVRTWAGRRGMPVRPGVAAWAAAVAGDRASAERLLSAAVADTGHTVKQVWAMAQTAALVGRSDEALRLYAEMDTLRYSTSEAINSDWVLHVRSYAARGALYEAAGDTAHARRSYRRVLELWKSPDPILREEAGAVTRALAELDRSDRNDVKR